MAQEHTAPLDRTTAPQRYAPLNRAVPLVPFAAIRRNASPLVIATLAAALAILTYFAPVSNTGSDPRYSLLTSQAILEQGTIRLDAYRDAGRLPEDDARLLDVEGHLYYYFPVGTSLLALPAVWIGKTAGLDMADFDEEATMQRVLASLLCAATLLVAYAIGRCYVAGWSACVIAAVLVFGSTLTSTMGTALWSLDFAVVLILLCLWLLALEDAGMAATVQPAWLGMLLFLAYLCRPPSVVLIGWAGVYLWFRDRRALVQTLLVLCFPLTLFLAFSMHEYGQLLPPYYLPERIGLSAMPTASDSTQTELATPTLLTLYGLLFSPGRGLFVYSPMLLIVALAALGTVVPARRLLALILLAWFVLHVVVLARFPIWWGGHSFGPRLFTDALPAFVVLAPMAWRRLSARSRWTTLPTAAAFLVTGAFAVAVHSYAGLYNVQTFYWNGGTLPPELSPPQVFDWRYPQFAASERSNCARNGEYMEGLLRDRRVDLLPYPPGGDIDANDASDFLPAALDPLWQSRGLPWAQRPADATDAGAMRLYLPLAVHQTRAIGPLTVPALFVGWSFLQEDTITSLCERASILLGPYAAEDTGGTAWLLLEVATLADQELDVLVNDETIARVRLEVVGVGETELVRLPFDAGLLSVEGGNRITIGLLRGAEAAFSQGVRLRSVMIEGGGDEARE